MNTDIKRAFTAARLVCGRMISANKTKPGGHFCVFNANVLTPSKGKVWFGDLDLTVDGTRLQKISEIIGEPLYVLREMDCRFDTEGLPVDELLKNAVWCTKCGRMA